MCRLGFAMPFTAPCKGHCFASSVVTPRGYKSKRPPLLSLTSSRTIRCCLLASFLEPKKGERESGGGERERGDFWGIESVAAPSLLSMAE
jgi:hypothetical protein